MYVHAYQSYVWNRVVSVRLQRFGLQPVVGDLVVDHSSAETLDQDFDEEEAEEELNGAATSHPNDEAQEEAIEDKDSSKHVSVRVLTQAEVDSGEYTIYDLVLPLPGFDVTYPTNSVAGVYEEILALDGLALKDLRHKQKGYELAGQYRKILAHPTNFQW